MGVGVMMRGYCWFYVESLGCGFLVVMSRHCCCCWCGSRGISVGSWFLSIDEPVSPITMCLPATVVALEIRLGSNFCYLFRPSR